MNYFRNNTTDVEGQEQQSSWQSQMGDEFSSWCPSLSYENRLYGFVGCLSCGLLFSLLGMMWATLARFTAFGLCFTLGSVMGLLSMGFLVGPCRQIKLMFSKHRWLASTMYLAAMAVTLVVGFSKNINGLLKLPVILVLVLVQFVAAAWYALSYIPYGRKVVSKATGGCIDFLF